MFLSVGWCCQMYSLMCFSCKPFPFQLLTVTLWASLIVFLWVSVRVSSPSLLSFRHYQTKAYFKTFWKRYTSLVPFTPVCLVFCPHCLSLFDVHLTKSMCGSVPRLDVLFCTVKWMWSKSCCYGSVSTVVWPFHLTKDKLCPTKSHLSLFFNLDLNAPQIKIRSFCFHLSLWRIFWFVQFDWISIFLFLHSSAPPLHPAQSHSRSMCCLLFLIESVCTQ